MQKIVLDDLELKEKLNLLRIKEKTDVKKRKEKKIHDILYLFYRRFY